MSELVAPQRSPLFSIITPVYNTAPAALEAAIQSVEKQEFKDWEFILVDDASTNPDVIPVLRRAFDRDSRIRVIQRAENGHIVAATNDGINAAHGKFIALLDHDDELTPDALAKFAEVIAANPEADFLYSDERMVYEDGASVRSPKPPYSPERLRAQMYIGHLAVYRTSLVRELGGMRPGYDGSQDHDLALRVSEVARQIIHLPHILYNWNAIAGSTALEGVESKPYAWDAGLRAVQDHLDRIGLDATAVQALLAGAFWINRRINTDKLVSVIIPTRGSTGLVWGEKRVLVTNAVRSLLEKGGYPNLEIVVVYDKQTPKSVLDSLRELAGNKLVLVKYKKPFNYSEKCNIGALHSNGEILVMLNDDIELISDDFIAHLVAPLHDPGVGATGARLLFSDSTIQHGGVIYHHGNPGHAFYQMPSDIHGPWNMLSISREVTALTAACLAVTREVFMNVGGFTETLPLNFNDVDFSMKIGRAMGLRLIWLANIQAYHFESKTRVPKVRDWELKIMKGRWGGGYSGADTYIPGAE